MKYIAVLLFLPLLVFSADEKGDYQKERYFPVGWEPPTVTNNGGVIGISPSVPNFDRSTRERNYIEVGNTSVKQEEKGKRVVFTIVLNGKAKKIQIGKTFRVKNQLYKFIGAEEEGYVIQDMKTKKKILFKKKPPKKDDKK